MQPLGPSRRRLNGPPAPFPDNWTRPVSDEPLRGPRTPGCPHTRCPAATPNGVGLVFWGYRGILGPFFRICRCQRTHNIVLRLPHWPVFETAPYSRRNLRFRPRTTSGVAARRARGNGCRFRRFQTHSADSAAAMVCRALLSGAAFRFWRMGVCALCRNRPLCAPRWLGKQHKGWLCGRWRLLLSPPICTRFPVFLSCMSVSGLRVVCVSSSDE